MKKLLCFDTTAVPSLSSGLRSGLKSYAVNVPSVGAPTALWLKLLDGRVIRISVEMHDLSGWNEVGTLLFELVGDKDAPAMTKLPAPWADTGALEKLVFVSDECEAECGFALRTRSNEVLTVVSGAGVYTLAIAAPFVQVPFEAENDLAGYVRRAF